MTLNQLLYVVEVSKTKSINATAHTLFVSQSCVSTAIRELEDELGILYISTFNQDYYEKTFKEMNLIFESIAEYEVYAYIGENHPLAFRDEIDLSELEEYPCLIFDQDENSSFYFYEEIISAYEYKNVIRTSDRATMIDLLQELDGYAVGIGTVDGGKTASGLKTVKIRTDEKINVGYVIREGHCLSEIAEKFIALFAADVTSL